MKKWWPVWCLVALCLVFSACKQNGMPPVQEDLQGQRLALGDKAPNVAFTDPMGNSVTLYELLEEKKMVMLNFWFVDCPYCVMEFPAIQQAYSQYAQDVAIVALTPYDSDLQILEFQQEHELEFMMCRDTIGINEAFWVTGYPTTVIIDRDGTVCMVAPGAVPQEEVFLRIFRHFTAEDYETTLVRGIAEFYED